MRPEPAPHAPNEIAPSRARLWFEASRPRTLPASLAPVAIGVTLAFADGAAHWPAAAAALLGAALIQIGANYANDYYDFVKGADTAARAGPRRLTQSGLASPQTMKRAAMLVFGLATLVGVYLVARGGAPILAVGLASLLCGVIYTGGPFPLGYRGLGDVFVLAFFGPIAVAGTYWVQALEMDWRPIAAGLGPGLISTAILAVNNLRDVDTDRIADKRTLAVRLGPGFARWEYAVCMSLALASPLIFWAAGAAGPGMLLPLLAAPYAFRVGMTVWTRRDGPALNGALADTGKALMLYAALFCVGWLI
ncbi:MAG: 1,4-dihydroxy-2-naphthoate polyprenyltransferase [Rubrimonas sp.]|uniref:1,4-dihydroxy-2-naphthoate polyprenyltransferase n=1 Tax=Rubrimonas sp. TaxID=2036015 RepID=UPI002FDD987C